ncbi:ribonuclease III domain-containing protein [Aspergillus avenaceus]|uniref:Ribonuclease III domain-containing protein n=1 Tax=Aspergillus avenaceus TaxID=36643 RepID=A0A5N6TRW7_ASPAV|nr:ribonuclease III domain-containing protein [Aspergillus avenaceus]
MADNSSEFECLIGYSFRNRDLMEEALQEASVVTPGNERLALIGDKVLALMLLQDWYRTGNSTADGTYLLQDFACNKILASRARSIGLTRFIHPRQDIKREIPEHVLATSIEAILGAVWLDATQNISEVQSVMDKLQIYPP